MYTLSFKIKSKWYALLMIIWSQSKHNSKRKCRTRSTPLQISRVNPKRTNRVTRRIGLCATISSSDEDRGR